MLFNQKKHNNEQDRKLFMCSRSVYDKIFREKCCKMILTTSLPEFSLFSSAFRKSMQAVCVSGDDTAMSSRCINLL